MSATEPTIRIYFSNLAVIDSGSNRRLPLSRLDSHSHIHGGLRIQVGGRFLPYLGYFGADDVCFSQWIVELENVYKAFQEKPTASYTFDEGEQGQPAFLFEREGEEAFVSITASEYSDGEADPQWQRVGFHYQDFQTQYRTLKALFLSELRQAAPEMYDRWVKWGLPGVTV